MTAAQRTWFRLNFPSQVEPAAASALLRALHGISTPGRQETFVLQASAHAGQISHFLAGPSNRVTAIRAQAESLIPGLQLTQEPWRPATVKRAWRLWLSSSRRPLGTTEPELTNRMLLAALAGAGRHEWLGLQWLVGPVRRPIAVGSAHPDLLPESWPLALATAPVLGGRTIDAEARQALRAKQGQPGWRAVGRIAITAATEPHARALVGQLIGALRTAEGPGVRLGVRPIRPDAAQQAKTPWFFGLALSVDELTALMAWPLGEIRGDLPVARRRAKLLPAVESVPRRGRIIAVEPTSDRPLALSLNDSLMNTLFMGPNGSGKSTVLLNLIAQDVAANRSVVVLEPKGDLIEDVLARVPESRRDQVVVLSPADARPIGFNPLLGGDPELAADQLLSIFARLNSDSWGPRLSQILHAALLTLAKSPDTSLAALPLLLTDAGLRRRLVGKLNDPFGVSPFWASYERMSPEGRAQVIAPVLNKIDPLLFRSSLRGVFGQAKPRFDLDEVFRSPRIVLIDLAKSQLGPEGARLLGNLLVRKLWNTTLARSSVPAAKRRPVMVYVDEFQDYSGIDDFTEILSQSRGFGVGWTLAHQYLGQLTPDLRAAVLSQARSRVLFQLTYDDAAVMARGHRELKAEDFTELPAREVYLRLTTGSEVTRYMSGRTLPPPEVISDPRQLRAASRDRWGIPRAETDTALRALIEPATGSAATPPAGPSSDPSDDQPNPQIGRRRRSKP